MKYAKKPVVIEAFQMTKERRWDNSEWPNWLNMAWNKENTEENSVYPAEKSISNFMSNKGMLCIHTLEGEHLISWGDYIIQGVKSELYPCKPDIFEMTYEKVEG